MQKYRGFTTQEAFNLRYEIDEAKLKVIENRENIKNTSDEILENDGQMAEHSKAIREYEKEIETLRKKINTGKERRYFLVEDEKRYENEKVNLVNNLVELILR